MAETVAIISLVSNIAQLTQSGILLVSIFRRFVNNTHPAAEVEERRRHLSIIVDELKSSLPGSCGNPTGNSGGLSQTSSMALVSSAEEIVKISSQLEKVLADYDPTTVRSCYGRLKKSLKYQLSGRRRVESLDNRLDGLRKRLETSILVDIRKQVKQLDHDFVAALNQQNQFIVRLLTDGVFNLAILARVEGEKTRALVVEEHKITRGAMSDGFAQTRDALSDTEMNLKTQLDSGFAGMRQFDSDEQARTRLLQSLEFVGKDARHNEIADPYKTTFEWIFDHDPHEKNTAIRIKAIQHSQKLIDWLASDQPLFWITGKPGAGKSTLMKFLCQHDDTLKILQDKDPGAFIVSSYLWSAGSPEQRQLRYVLASLLHQVLEHSPETISKLLNELNGSSRRRSLVDWSDKALELALCIAIDDSPSTICIFMDGLDEIDNTDLDGFGRILNLINCLRIRSNVKLCVASRRLSLFLNAFCPNFQLQDLTNDDLRYFITMKLDHQKTNFQTQFQDLEKFESLIDLILEKAQGVFLWVSLVVASISSGLDEYDDEATLLGRIGVLPSELAALYTRMWERSNRGPANLRSTGARYLKMLLFQQVGPQIHLSHDSSILRFFLLTDTSIQEEYLSTGEFSTEQELVKNCEQLRHQILARCAGLVEVDPIEGNGLGSLRNASIRFIHKSAVDFLTGTEEGRNILELDENTTVHVYVRVLMANSVQILMGRQFPRLAHWPTLSYYLTDTCGPDTQLMLNDEQLSHLVLDVACKTASRLSGWSTVHRDFVCTAASFGMMKYVKDSILKSLNDYSTLFQRARTKSPNLLGASQWISDTESKSFILSFACLALGHGRFYDNTELVLWLLEHGADPNMATRSERLLGTTAFHSFLISAKRRISQALSKSSTLPIREATALLRVLEGFISYKAILQTPFLVRLWHCPIASHWNDELDFVIPYHLVQEPKQAVAALPRKKIKSERQRVAAIRDRLTIFAEYMDITTDIRNTCLAVLHPAAKDVVATTTTTQQYPSDTESAASNIKIKVLMRRHRGKLSAKMVDLEENHHQIFAVAVHRPEDASSILSDIYDSMNGPILDFDEIVNVLEREDLIGSKYMALGYNHGVTDDYLPDITSDQPDWEETLDTSHDPTYSKLVQVLSQIPWDQEAKETFMQHCRQQGKFWADLDAFHEGRIDLPKL